MADPWLTTRVVGIFDETARAKSFRLALPGPSGHRAGQHYVLRLTAPDGYQAMRSYSVASPPVTDPTDPAADEIELTIERLEGGEVSSFVHDVVTVGDELEVRGPIGGWFVWDGDTPAVLIGGGSGLVPLMAMLRLARRTGRGDLVKLLVSVRSPGDLLYADELPGPETTVVYSRAAPAGAVRPPGRLTQDDVEPLLLPDATCFICGSAGFADAASRLLTDLGVPAERIRVERFGPSNG